MELKIYRANGEDSGRTIIFGDAIVGIEPNEHVMWLDVKHFMANRRQGTHKTKERSELSGSTRKLIRQKGSGGARRGDINSPLMRGGARVFGPQPRDYSFKLNKKVKQLARFSSLSQKAREGRISVIEDFSFETPKTKEMLKVINALGLGGDKSLFVFGSVDKNVFLSSRNLPKVQTIRNIDLNTYAILNASKLVFTESAVRNMNMLVEK